MFLTWSLFYRAIENLWWRPIQVFKPSYNDYTSSIRYCGHSARTCSIKFAIWALLLILKLSSWISFYKLLLKVQALICWQVLNAPIAISVVKIVKCLWNSWLISNTTMRTRHSASILQTREDCARCDNFVIVKYLYTKHLCWRPRPICWENVSVTKIASASFEFSLTVCSDIFARHEITHMITMNSKWYEWKMKVFVQHPFEKSHNVLDVIP